MGLQTLAGVGKVVPMTLPKDYVSTAPATTDNPSVDTKGFRFALIIVQGGVLTSGTSWQAVVQQSSDNAVGDAFANIETTPTAKTSVTLTASDDGEAHAVLIDCNSTERYLALNWVETGTFTVSLLSAVCVLTNAADTAFIGTSNIDGQYP